MGRSALLTIDMHNDIAHPEGRALMPDAAHKVPVMNAILDAWREAREPVIHVIRSYRADTWDVERFRVPAFQADRGWAIEGTWGQRIVDRLTPEAGEPVVVKQRFSAFAFTELDLLLRRAGVTKVVVCGVNLPNCPRTTMYDAVGLDYDVVAVADALATTDDETHRSNLKDLAAIGVRVATAEDVIKEVARAAERMSPN